MQHIIEYLGAEGVISSPLTALRWQTPHPGDAVLFPDGHHGMVDGLGVGLARPDEYHICEHPNSVFLSLLAGAPDRQAKTYVSISGGPFSRVRPDQLRATFQLHTTQMWNWGDHSPGAHQGVYYLIPRPVFQLIP